MTIWLNVRRTWLPLHGHRLMACIINDNWSNISDTTSVSSSLIAASKDRFSEPIHAFSWPGLGCRWEIKRGQSICEAVQINAMLRQKEICIMFHGQVWISPQFIETSLIKTHDTRTGTMELSNPYKPSISLDAPNVWFVVSVGNGLHIRKMIILGSGK